LEGPKFLKMIIKQVIDTTGKNWAPLNYAEDFDNVGLLVGEMQI